MDHLSLIRLAADLGFFPEKFRALADRMFIEVQPGHVQLSAGNQLSQENVIYEQIPWKNFFEYSLNLDAQVD